MLQSFCVLYVLMIMNTSSSIVVSLKEIMIAAKKDSIGNIVEKLLFNFNMGGKILNELMMTRGQRRLYKRNYLCYVDTLVCYENFYKSYFVFSLVILFEMF